VTAEQFYGRTTCSGKRATPRQDAASSTFDSILHAPV
jgi:hypothetical protein